MDLADLSALSPLLSVAGGSVVVMLVAAFRRDHRLAYLLTLAGLALGFVALPLVMPTLPRHITPLVIVDGSAVFYLGLLLATSFAVTILSFGYFQGYEGNREEYYVLLLLATLGSGVLVVSNHFASFFLGLEILSIALYALIAYPRYQDQRVEAAVKYLVLAGATSAFLLFGMALVYNELGTMDFTAIAGATARSGQGVVFLAGLALIGVGVGFKLALVPFHMWTPDVYQGAPAPVTGFIATVSKGGVFALMLRYYTQASIHEGNVVWALFAAIAVATMLLGNLLALIQDNLKRVLAYSSITHLGYLLVAFLASGALAERAIAFYLAAYFITTLCGFGVITVLSRHDREVEALDDYRGLFWRRPWLAVLMTVTLLSLAGIPPTVGLVAKIFVAAAGVESALWSLLIVLVVASVIGIFYYMRIVIAMFRRPPEGEVKPAAPPSLSPAGGVVLGLLAVCLVWLGLYPSPLVRIIETTVANLR